MRAQAQTPERQIRAHYDDDSIRVYQAYSHSIGESALTNGRFVSPPFKMERMTWIKPSFLWMMYRSGWGLKDEKQQCVLAIDITREGFEWALSNSCLSHVEPEKMNRDEWHALKFQSPVRVQWDPERDLALNPLRHRSIQIGLSGRAVEKYVLEWTVKITNITDLAHQIHQLVRVGRFEEASELLPVERPYPLSEALRERLGASISEAVFTGSGN
jgi:hypothetical protein